jgi:hypothetical protein
MAPAMADAPVTVEGAQVPLEQWRPAVPAVLGDPNSRSPVDLLVVVNQFDVLHSGRYQPVPGKTFCNILSWDVTSALQAEIPHWVNPAGSPAKMGTNGSRELSANATLEWLVAQGPAQGWLEVDEPTARANASQGLPTVASWENPLPGHSGHIAVILPDDPGVDGPVIAQAGLRCLFGVALSTGFGSIKPRFFSHA